MADAVELDLRALPSTREYIAYQDGGHFPVVVQAHNGTLVAAVRGGAGHLGLHGRLDVIRSYDGGRHWSPPDVLAESELDDRNPAVGVAQNGDLVLAYRREGRYNEAGRYDSIRPARSDDRPTEVRVTRSHDNGLTWERPAVLDIPLLRTGSPFGKIVTLDDGTLLLPIYDVYEPHDSEPVPSEDVFSYLVRSRDHGATWEDPTPIAGYMGETTLHLLPNGELLAMMRDRGNAPALWSAHSADGGSTWSAPVQVTGAMQHPADVVTLRDGSVLLSYGSRKPPYRVEGRLSRDNGRSWLPPLLAFTGQLYGYNIEGDRPYDFGYPSSVVIDGKDGRQGVTLWYINPSLHTQRANRAPGTDFYGSYGYYARSICWSEDELLDAFDKL